MEFLDSNCPLCTEWCTTQKIIPLNTMNEKFAFQGSIKQDYLLKYVNIQFLECQ